MFSKVMSKLLFELVLDSDFTLKSWSVSLLSIPFIILNTLTVSARGRLYCYDGSPYSFILCV